MFAIDLLWHAWCWCCRLQCPADGSEYGPMVLLLLLAIDLNSTYISVDVFHWKVNMISSIHHLKLITWWVGRAFARTGTNFWYKIYTGKLAKRMWKQLNALTLFCICVHVEAITIDRRACWTWSNRAHVEPSHWFCGFVCRCNRMTTEMQLVEVTHSFRIDVKRRKLVGILAYWQMKYSCEVIRLFWNQCRCQIVHFSWILLTEIQLQKMTSREEPAFPFQMPFVINFNINYWWHAV